MTTVITTVCFTYLTFVMRSLLIYAMTCTGCLTIVTESQGYKLCLNFAVADHVAPSPRTYGGSPVYTLDHISSISLRLQPDIWFPSKNIGIVDEFLAPLHNLQELRFEPSQRIPMHKPASSEVMFGFGQYWAEFLPQTRERCHLEILVGDTVVPWVHLFEQEMTASIEEDYRSQYLRWRNEL